MVDPSACRHPGTISVARQPGVWECVTCGALLREQPDGTLAVEVRGQ